jgi:hypothetical protein
VVGVADANVLAPGTEDAFVETVVDVVEDGTYVPLRMYKESRLPAPQNSPLLAAQLIEQSVSASLTLVLPNVLPQ